MYTYRNKDAKPAIDNMIESLEYKADQARVSLNGITKENFGTFLDDLFEDGGEVRCIYFTDISAEEFAMDFGEIESDPFDNAHWFCIDWALRLLEQKYSA